MTNAKRVHLTVQEREARGSRAREQAPPSAHGAWSPAVDRADPVLLLMEQDRKRERDLVPVRHGRMLLSPFTFYRGAAKVMSNDLAGTPTAGLNVQLCGDAHLENFGLFASPERNLLFDVNDFDETLPGPFEYDVKRLAASFVIAARNNGFSYADARAIATAVGTSYHEAMISFSRMRTLDIWYARLDENDLRQSIKAAVSKERALAKAEKGKKSKQAKEKEKLVERAERKAEKTDAKAHARDSMQALSKLCEPVDGRYRIMSHPPIVVPIRDLAASYEMSPDQLNDALHKEYRAYVTTLDDDRREVLERFHIVDIARKVVGVGSVGTRCFIVLLEGRDADDPLFLQIKEATESVLEDSLPKSRYPRPGERVVQGQRMMQAASDIFLGWAPGFDPTRHYYWRQLRDMKGAADVEAMWPTGMTFYARTCGWTLARAHARSGDPIAIAAYLGDDDSFARAITQFSERYADQNEEDYQSFAEQIRAGRVQAMVGV